MTKIDLLPFADIKKKLEQLCESRIIVVLDGEVAKLWPELQQSVLNDPNRFLVKTILGGEECKSFAVYQEVAEFFIGKGIHRNTHLVAIGGGAISDLAGFVASTLLRGLAWSVIPTTLLATVDAAIGGKTAINSQFGKNLLGTFHLPDHVWIDLEFLGTLPSDQFNSGLGEIVKYGLLSPEICQAIEDNLPLADIALSCAKFKQHIVERDFRETGARRALNLGHTIGHALESTCRFPHGIAVYWGLLLEHQIFGLSETVSKVRSLGAKLAIDCTKFPLPERLPVDGLLERMGRDKKMQNATEIVFVVCETVGKPSYPSLALAELKKCMVVQLRTFQGSD